MTLNDILSYLSDDYAQQLAMKKRRWAEAEAAKQARREQIAKEFSMGQSDALPYTLERRLQDQSPYFMELLRKPPADKRSQYEMEQDWDIRPRESKIKML